MERPHSTPGGSAAWEPKRGEPKRGGSVTWASGEPLVSDETISRALHAALRHGGVEDRTVDVVLVGDDALAEMHGTFLGDPTATDVITFDLSPQPGEPADPEAGPDGELYVSVDTASRVAAERGVSVERELCLYIVHGALHLSGMDDHDPTGRKAMRAAEGAVMSALGYAADAAPHDVD